VQGRPFAYHAYGTAVTEVTLDCLRGVYRIDAVQVVQDVGTPCTSPPSAARWKAGWSKASAG